MQSEPVTDTQESFGESATVRGPFVRLPKVVGGYTVPIDRVPFLVSVRRRLIHENQFGQGHVCGGAIISQRLVCSAAHCYNINNTEPHTYHRPELFVVLAGMSVIDQRDRATQEYHVQQIIGHEHYDSLTLANDIALLFLNGYIPWGSKVVRAVPLVIDPPPTGTSCLIHGWGKPRKWDTTLTLQQAPVPILKRELCRFIYKQPESQMCAGFLQGGIDACQGDSGGPLVCNGYLAGIISWGVGCADPGFPGVYTNVSKFVDWIRVVNFSLDYSTYLDMRLISGQSGRSHNCGPLALVILNIIIIMVVGLL
ncbi:hypothetical protein KR200_010233 [Drosophila serrata]|nr:hypothetical protein KR200_010233 [Drosophila serrata]